jgi:toxin CptA
VHKQQAPLLLNPKPSTRLKQAVIASHILAVAASISNALPIAIQGALLAACAVHCYFNLNRLKNASVKIKHSDVSGWEISDTDEEFQAVQILTTTVITSFLVLIHYQVQSALGVTTKRMRTLLVINDALDQKDFRSLVVRLKTTAVMSN